MELPRDLLTDEHIIELLAYARKMVGWRQLRDIFDPADVVSRMLFPSREVKQKADLADEPWAGYLRQKRQVQKPSGMSWPTFITELVQEVETLIREHGPQNSKIKARDIVVPLLYDLKDERGQPPPAGVEFARCRLIARKPLTRPWELFLMYELRNTLRDLLRERVAENRGVVPISEDPEDGDELDALSVMDWYGEPPEDLAAEDALARYTEMAQWAIDNLVEKGVLRDPLQANHFRTVFLQFMNPFGSQSEREIASTLADEMKLSKAERRTFQKNFGRWRDEIRAYLKNRYEAEMRNVQTGTRR